MKIICSLFIGLFTVQVVWAKFRTYSAEIDHLEIVKSPGGNSFDFKTLRVTKFNRTIYIVKANFEVTDSTSETYVEFSTYLMQGNEYKQAPYKVKKKPLCDAYKNEFQFYVYHGLKNFSNLPKPEECPFPKRQYWVNNYVFDEETANLPPYIALGKHRFDVLFFEKNVESGGFRVYFTAVKSGTN